jgi:hypothetical protein
MEKEIQGYAYFYFNEGKVDSFVNDKNEERYKGIEDMCFPSEEIYDMFDGLEFADMIDNGGIIDYDGSLADIFVEDYKSNLGICADNFHQGKFMVDLNTFRDLCGQYKIEVNWANK